MRLLAFDVLGAAPSAVAVAGGREAAFGTVPAGNVAESLLPLLDGTLAEAGWGWGDVDLLAVTVGPGGFTAVRAGLAVARALSLALDRPAEGVGALEAVAEAAGPGPLLVLKDVRRGEVAAQGFGADLRPEGPVLLLDLEDALAAAIAAPRLAGDGAALLAGRLPPGKPVVEGAPDARYVAAAALRRAAAPGWTAAAGTGLRPVYPRPPDARPEAGRPLVAAAAGAR